MGLDIFSSILNLFRKKDSFDLCKSIFDKNKEANVNKELGITTPNCPYCNTLLEKFPSRKTKCKNCNNFIYVRTRPSDRKKILVKDNELDLVQEEWEKESNNVAVVYDRKEKNQIPTLDATQEYIKAKQKLLDTYTNIEPYYPFMLLDDNEKQILLTCVYNYWGFHGVPKDIYNLFPNWNKKLLAFVCLMENFRLGNFIHIYYYERQKQNSWWQLLGDENRILCPFEDIKHLLYTNFLFYQSYNTRTMRNVIPASGDIQSYVNGPLKMNEIFIYNEGELYKITNKKDFDEFKNKTNTTLVWDKMQELYKEILKEKNIPFDETKPLTKAKAVKLLKQHNILP